MKVLEIHHIFTPSNRKKQKDRKKQESTTDTTYLQKCKSVKPVNAERDRRSVLNKLHNSFIRQRRSFGP